MPDSQQEDTRVLTFTVARNTTHARQEVREGQCVGVILGSRMRHARTLLVYWATHYSQEECKRELKKGEHTRTTTSLHRNMIQMRGGRHVAAAAE